MGRITPWPDQNDGKSQRKGTNIESEKKPVDCRRHQHFLFRSGSTLYLRILRHFALPGPALSGICHDPSWIETVGKIREESEDVFVALQYWYNQMWRAAKLPIYIYISIHIHVYIYIYTHAVHIYIYML